MSNDQTSAPEMNINIQMRKQAQSKKSTRRSSNFNRRPNRTIDQPIYQSNTDQRAISSFLNLPTTTSTVTNSSLNQSINLTASINQSIDTNLSSNNNSSLIPILSSSLDSSSVVVVDNLMINQMHSNQPIYDQYNLNYTSTIQPISDPQSDRSTNLEFICIQNAQNSDTNIAYNFNEPISISNANTSSMNTNVTYTNNQMISNNSNPTNTTDYLSNTNTNSNMLLNLNDLDMDLLDNPPYNF